MPTTEAPPPQRPGTEGQDAVRVRRRGASHYEDGQPVEGYDLLHVLDELKDDRARVALREKIWIALILHLLLFGYIILAPKYIYHVKVRDIALKQQNPIFLSLPPDVLKQLKPKVPAPLSDKNRQQQAPHPVPNRKMIRLPGPPVLKPTPRPTPRAQQPPAPQVARQQAPAPKAPRAVAPAPRSQTAQIEAPKPNFSAAAQTPAESLAQEARRAERGSTFGGGDMGAPAPHGGNQGAVDVLSDTLGVDFGPYIQRVIYDTKRAWYPIIPEVAQPPINKQGRVIIRFRILPDGSVAKMTLEGPSGDVSLDRAAWGGITGASPFPPLPKNFRGPYLELRFYFMYNETPGGQ